MRAGSAASQTAGTSVNKPPRWMGNPVEIFGTLIDGVRFAADSTVEGDGFEPSVPREGLAEDRDDGSPFRGRWRRKILAKESSESAVQMNMRSWAITRANVVIRTSVPYLPPVEGTRRRYRPSRNPLGIGRSRRETRAGGPECGSISNTAGRRQSIFTGGSFRD
jgi:hypothetical protein